MSALCAVPASADPRRDDRVRYADAANAVDSSYLVTFKASLPQDSAKRRSLIKQYDGKIAHVYREALNGYAIKASADDAERLAADPAVASVVQNRTFSIAATQTDPPSWGLDRIDQKSLPLDTRFRYSNKAGANATVYVLDTGIRITHQELAGRASYGYDAIDNDSSASDSHGHGTHVAGTVAGLSVGVAKKAKIVSVRVLNKAGSGTTAQVIAGIDWVIRHAVKPAVIHMSLGGSADTLLDATVRKAVAAGISVVAAAGNESRDAAGSSPARVGEAITVGATDRSDARAGYSNYGAALDLFAPGSSIRSAYHSSDAAFATSSGTSMAAPHVSGAAALFLAENPSATPAQVASALKNTAFTGAVSGAGQGSPSRLLKAPGPVYRNTTDFAIRDHTTAQSPVSVSGEPGKASTTLGAEVHIRHTYVGDLQVKLIAPDGTQYMLKQFGTGGSADSIDTTYKVNASSESASGTWRLRVTDGASADTGKIDSWALRF
ncbi:S8 family serine peptidase [Streptomyces sp. NPDC126514]|uniref:S8 family peptidase n=1 Tax=Streptomyces sp. NPDC126514 TaxID=3155210 RepID=UPI0033217E90